MSFPYSEYYYNNGICHMELENSAKDGRGETPDDRGETPTFILKSDLAVQPQTWGPGLKPTNGVQQSDAVAVTSTTITSSKALKTPPISSSAVPSLAAHVSSTPNPSSIPSTPTPPQPTPPLSSGAKAGISIGSIFCALLLIIAVLLFLNARRSRQMIPRRFFQKLPKQTGHEAALPDRSPVEVRSNDPCEVDGLGRPNELDGMPRSELRWTVRGVEMETTITSATRERR